MYVRFSSYGRFCLVTVCERIQNNAIPCIDVLIHVYMLNSHYALVQTLNIIRNVPSPPVAFWSNKNEK